jgi:hypothetical protein
MHTHVYIMHYVYTMYDAMSMPAVTASAVTVSRVTETHKILEHCILHTIGLLH